MRLYVYSFCKQHQERPLRPLDGLSLSSTVIELKHLIVQQVGIPYYEQRVTFAAKHIFDHEQLGDCFGLRPGSTFQLFQVQAPSDADEPPSIPPPRDSKAEQEAADLKLARLLASQMDGSSSSSEQN